MISENRSLYMHTIDGKPAQYYPETGYICFTQHVTRLEPSLYRLRKQQDAVREKDAAEGNGLKFNYGYVRVRIPR